MLKKISLTVLGVFLGTLFISHLSFGQSTTSTSSTTQTTKQTVTTPAAPAKPAKKAAAKAAPTVETTESTVTTTPATPRPAYDQAMLKKMNLCVDGFDGKAGNDNKNVCSGMATAPDMAYACIWKKKGEAAYPSTPQGPCKLDNTEHRGNVIITKADYKSSPPLPYGTKVECCFRAAKGPAVTSTTSSSSTTPVKK